YSAFLFAQAKGRDLWQSPMFFWHLLVQAFVAGAAVFLLVTIWAAQSAWIGGTGRLDMAGLEARRAFYMMGWAFFILVSALALSLAMVLAEVLLPHVTEDVRLAARNLVRGPLRFRFWLLAIGAGLVLPIVLLSCVFVIKISLRTD